MFVVVFPLFVVLCIDLTVITAVRLVCLDMQSLGLMANDFSETLVIIDATSRGPVYVPCTCAEYIYVSSALYP